eukprot:CAMPEP_0113662244 /NCGR_PEP_ID=MMETSP0038_2-20120614/459_1 /TAXON_ID=2898 /ORGANISM="Cryptomonas paramecium" /LENGTH=191 /DNA_ID=CAMNT_0000577099 /DNA_START=39 /DNA_END=610 /DNA_ORIENTATION=- /assembly_acc=CAM_ASM_000170
MKLRLNNPSCVGLLLVLVLSAHLVGWSQAAVRPKNITLEEAESRLEDLKVMLAEKLMLVDQIRSDLTGRETSCSSKDQECHNYYRDEFDDKVPEGFHIVAHLQIPPNLPELIHVKWLPFPKAHSSVTALNKLLIAVDKTGVLHFFDSTGVLVSSVHSGHSDRVTALAASAKVAGECTIATGSASGEVRVHA